MKIKAFTLQYDPEQGAFDEAALQGFLADRDLLSVQEHFFQREGEPLWALLLTYRDRARPGERPLVERSGTRTDWRAELPEEERPLYDALRSWRSDKARQAGRPPYIFLTNQQIAKIAMARPRTLEALREVHGVGDAKCEAFGEEVLAIVAQMPHGLVAEDSVATGDLGGAGGGDDGLA